MWVLYRKLLRASTVYKGLSNMYSSLHNPELLAIVMQHQLLKQVLTTLNNDNSSTLYEHVLQTLRSQDPAHQRPSLLSCIPDVLDALSEQSTEALAAGAIRVAAATYQLELRMLIHPQNGFHFAGTSASLG